MHVDNAVGVVIFTCMYQQYCTNASLEIACMTCICTTSAMPPHRRTPPHAKKMVLTSVQADIGCSACMEASALSRRTRFGKLLLPPRVLCFRAKIGLSTPWLFPKGVIACT